MARLAALAASRRRLLDHFEQVVVVVLYVWLTLRLWPDNISASNWLPLIMLLSERIVVVLLLLRRPTERISMNLQDWALAAGGTFLFMLVDESGTPMLGALGAGLMLLGLIVRCSAKLSLRRSFGLVAANRGIKVGGAYRIVRHPMYAGYILAHIGFLLTSPTLWNLTVYVSGWALLVARIYAEERVLSEDPDYQAFKARVPYRLVPGIF